MMVADPQDDTSIEDETVLWRRVHPEQLITDNNNDVRPSSQAFQNTSGTNGMSVNIAEETTIEDTLKGFEDHFIAAFDVGVARKLNQGIVRKPFDVNAAHAEVTGKKTGSVRKKIVAASSWVVEP